MKKIFVLSLLFFISLCSQEFNVEGFFSMANLLLQKGEEFIDSISTESFAFTDLNPSFYEKAENLKENSFNFTQGFVQGLLPQYLDDFTHCVTGFPEFYSNVKTCFKEMFPLNQNNIKFGLIKIFMNAGSILSEIKACSNTTTLVTSAIQVLLNYNPKLLLLNIGSNFIFHGINILTYIIKAVSDFTTGDMYSSGKQIGLALNRILLPTFSID
jgi:hypothetical protein